MLANSSFGTAGIDVASDTRELGFESSHQQRFNKIVDDWIRALVLWSALSTKSHPNKAYFDLTECYDKP